MNSSTCPVFEGILKQHTFLYLVFKYAWSTLNLDHTVVLALTSTHEKPCVVGSNWDKIEVFTLGEHTPNLQAGVQNPELSSFLGTGWSLLEDQSTGQSTGYRKK